MRGMALLDWMASSFGYMCSYRVQIRHHLLRYEREEKPSQDCRVASASLEVLAKTGCAAYSVLCLQFLVHAVTNLYLLAGSRRSPQVRK